MNEKIKDFKLNYYKDRNLTVESKAILGYLIDRYSLAKDLSMPIIIQKLRMPSAEVIAYELNITVKRYYSHRKLLIKYGYLVYGKHKNDIFMNI